MISRLIGSHLVLCIDEFQRIGALNTTSRNRILSSVRTAFSRNPRYLSVILAIQSMVERSALDLLPPELKTLIGRKPSISLPEMDVREGKEFIAGRFACFRPAGYRCTEFAPFEAAAIDGVLEFLHVDPCSCSWPLHTHQIMALSGRACGKLAQRLWRWS
jgi:hypothetical protein